MPVKKQHRSILAIFAGLLALATVGFGQSQQAILDYYWNKAGDVWQDRRNADSSLAYQVTARSLYKKLDRSGEVSRVDTALITYHFSGPTLDSQVVVEGSEEQFDQVNLLPPNIFAHDYLRNLYPNDDGVGDLAIGIDTDSLDVNVPTGMVLVDRRNYQPRWLYLHYTPEGDYTRFTRSFRFTEHDGLIVPDSVWVVAAKRGVLFTEFFRIETAVTDITVSQ